MNIVITKLRNLFVQTKNPQTTNITKEQIFVLLQDMNNDQFDAYLNMMIAQLYTRGTKDLSKDKRDRTILERGALQSIKETGKRDDFVASILFGILTNDTYKDIPFDPIEKFCTKEPLSEDEPKKNDTTLS